MSQARHNLIHLSLIPIHDKIWKSFYALEIYIENFSEILKFHCIWIERNLDHARTIVSRFIIEPICTIKTLICCTRRTRRKSQCGITRRCIIYKGSIRCNTILESSSCCIIDLSKVSRRSLRKI